MLLDNHKTHCTRWRIFLWMIYTGMIKCLVILIWGWSWYTLKYVVCEDKMRKKFKDRFRDVHFELLKFIFLFLSFILKYFVMISKVSSYPWYFLSPIDLLCKSHSAPVPSPTVHHFVREMCTCVHIYVTKWCIVRYLVNALRLRILWDGSMDFHSGPRNIQGNLDRYMI